MSGFSIGCVALMSIIVLSMKSMLDTQCVLATCNADENEYYASLIELEARLIHVIPSSYMSSKITRLMEAGFKRGVISTCILLNNNNNALIK